MKLTDGMVRDKLAAPEKGNRITYDEKVKGFGCRVTSAGARSFILNYSTDSGRERRLTIGSFPDWSVAAARMEAKRLKREIDQGFDPLAEKQAIRSAPSVADLCERFIEERLPALREKTRVNYRGEIANNILPAMKHHKVAEVSYVDIDALHRKLTREGKVYLANRVLSLLSAMFSEAMRWKWCKVNPCQGVRRNHEDPRERYLTPDELVRLTEALAKDRDAQAATIVRLLLLTGARRGEVLSASWSQFNLELGVWTKPAHTTKQKKDHVTPLSAPARQLLQELRAAAPADATHLFRGGRQRLDKSWPRICRTAGLENFRVHDLRHSYASFLASGGHSLPLIGALLGHSNPATTARYAHLLDDPLRKATETVGAIVTGAPSAEVVSIKGR
jgi:integrase